MTVTSKEPKITTREQLITALKTAAEIEHLLCCEYLYSGFSVRRTLADFPPETPEALGRVILDKSNPWLAQLYMIARQEMEHLGIVCNLLNAIGAEPHLWRPEFPQPPRRTLLDVPMGLDRFGQTSLQRFVWGERPSYLTPSFPRACYGLETWEPHAAEPLAVDAFEISTVEELYEEIGCAFATLPADDLFIGDPDRQLGDVFSHRVKMVGVGNRQEAQEAIRQILIEGEGMGQNPLSSTCHFERLVRMLTELEEAQEANPQFEPAMPVVTNPLVKPHPEDYPASVITHPETVEVMRFFNSSYHAMLVMLKTFFVNYSRTNGPKTREANALFYGAFFPLMTMVIRPLGELLARMPAGDEYPGQTAGASFEIDEPVTVQEDVEWYRARMQLLASQGRDLVDVVPDRLRPTMQGLYENITSTGLHLEHIWQKGI